MPPVPNPLRHLLISCRGKVAKAGARSEKATFRRGQRSTPNDLKSCLFRPDPVLGNFLARVGAGGFDDRPGGVVGHCARGRAVSPPLHEGDCDPEAEVASAYSDGGRHHGRVAAVEIERIDLLEGVAVVDIHVRGYP